MKCAWLSAARACSISRLRLTITPAKKMWPREVPANLNLTREYLRLKVVEDGYKLKWETEPLKGEIHSGDIIVVRLKLNGGTARHLMIEDPIPAGAEQVESVGNLNLERQHRTRLD